MEYSSENELNSQVSSSFDESSDCDVYDILDRFLTPKEELVGTIKSIQLMIETQPIISLMRDDIDYHEYNRSYNYYYKDEYNKKYDDKEKDLEDIFRMNYDSKQIEINTMIKNIIKFSKQNTNEHLIECIDYMLQVFIIDILDKINYYTTTGKGNCLYEMNHKSYKILNSFCNKDKMNRIQEYYDIELQSKKCVDKKSFMNVFLYY